MGRLTECYTWSSRFGGRELAKHERHVASDIIEKVVARCPGAGTQQQPLHQVYDEAASRPRRRCSHYAALYALPGAIRAGFAQFNAFPQDAADNKRFIEDGGKLDVPVLAMEGEAAAGGRAEMIMRFAADHVEGAVVPNSGNWLMEENPNETVRLVQQFLS